MSSARPPFAVSPRQVALCLGLRSALTPVSQGVGTSSLATVPSGRRVRPPRWRAGSGPTSAAQAGFTRPVSSAVFRRARRLRIIAVLRDLGTWTRRPLGPPQPLPLGELEEPVGRLERLVAGYGLGEVGLHRLIQLTLGPVISLNRGLQHRLFRCWIPRRTIRVSDARYALSRAPFVAFRLGKQILWWVARHTLQLSPDSSDSLPAQSDAFRSVDVPRKTCPLLILTDPWRPITHVTTTVGGITRLRAAMKSCIACSGTLTCRRLPRCCCTELGRGSTRPGGAFGPSTVSIFRVGPGSAGTNGSHGSIFCCFTTRCILVMQHQPVLWPSGAAWIRLCACRWTWPL